VGDVNIINIIQTTINARKTSSSSARVELVTPFHPQTSGHSIFEDHENFFLLEQVTSLLQNPYLGGPGFSSGFPFLR
jgi:hypothetical protein